MKKAIHMKNQVFLTLKELLLLQAKVSKDSNVKKAKVDDR